MAKISAPGQTIGFCAFTLLLTVCCAALWITAVSGTAQEAALSQSEAAACNEFTPWDEAGVETPPVTWPAWVRGWSCDGGVIRTNPPGWYVEGSAGQDGDEAARSNAVGLYVMLERSALTNDLIMEVSVGHAAADAALHVDLLDTNLVTVTAGLNENVLQTGATTTELTIGLPLVTNQAVEVIRLRHGAGEVLLYSLRLSEIPAAAVDVGEAADRAAGGRTPEAASAGVAGKGPDVAETPAAGVPAGSRGNPAPEEEPEGGARGKVVYVDAQRGNDAHDGFASAPESSGRGPKKSINGALRTVRQGDSISVGSGTYRESADFRGTGVDVYFTGTVFM